VAARDYRRVGYRDELLADRSVQRSYADGRREWRRRAGTGVDWRDDRGRTGHDEPLGHRIVKRVVHPDQVLYGRELGYGRTAWSDGVLTVNESSRGGRVGAILAGIGAAALLPAVIDPPSMLGPEEEEQLRQQAAASSGGGGGGEADPGGDDDWSDPGDGSDDDFG
jgi:hypothetical protein